MRDIAEICEIITVAQRDAESEDRRACSVSRLSSQKKQQWRALLSYDLISTRTKTRLQGSQGRVLRERNLGLQRLPRRQVW